MATQINFNGDWVEEGNISEDWNIYRGNRSNWVVEHGPLKTSAGQHMYLFVAEFLLYSDAFAFIKMKGG